MYPYCIKEGYYSGSFWHWFNRTNLHKVQTRDQVWIRYHPLDPTESVFEKFT